MFSFATKKNSVLENWKDSFALFFSTFSNTWPIFLLLMILTCCSNCLRAYLIGHPMGFATFFMMRCIIFSWDFLVIIFLASIFLHRIYQLVEKPNSCLGDSFKLVLKKFIQILLANTSFFIIFAIGGALVIGALALIDQFLFASSMPYFYSVMIALLFVEFMILSFYFISLRPLILLENKNFLQAIKGSWKMVAGNWWRVFGAMLPIAFFAMVTATAVKISFIINPRTFYLPGEFTCLAAQMFYNFIVVWVGAAFILVVFNDLKLRKR